MEPHEPPSGSPWADHVRAVLGDDEPYDSGLADILADDDRHSAEFETDSDDTRRR